MVGAAATATDACQPFGSHQSVQRVLGVTAVGVKFIGKGVSARESFLGLTVEVARERDRHRNREPFMDISGDRDQPFFFVLEKVIHGRRRPRIGRK
jgi:hypothetical protein